MRAALPTQTSGGKKSTVADVARDAVRKWNDDMRQDVAADDHEFREFLHKAVSIAADTPANLPALSKLYQDWVDKPVENLNFHLDPDLASDLLCIENRLGRAIDRQSSDAQLISCLLRQAALTTCLDGIRGRRALDDVVESAIEAGIEKLPRRLRGLEFPVGDEINRRLNILKEFESNIYTRNLQDLYGPPDDHRVKLADNYTILFSDAFSVAPPSLRRFVFQDMEDGSAALRRGAQSVPDLANRLHRQLQIWTETRIPRGRRNRIENCVSALRKAMADWLNRSTPESSADELSPERRFARWHKHLERARLVRADQWRKSWYFEQIYCAVAEGLAMANNEDAWRSSLKRFTNLCIHAHRIRVPPLPVCEDDYFQSLAKRMAMRLDPEKHTGLLDRIEDIDNRIHDTTRLKNFQRWFSTGFQDDADRNAANDALNALDECTNELETWLLIQLESRIFGTPPQPVAHGAGLLGLSTENLKNILLYRFSRAEFLKSVRGRAAKGESNRLGEFLMILDEAVVNLAGRYDSAISIALAELYLEQRAWSKAEATLEKTLKYDRRPKTRAICLALKAECEERKNPLNAKTWLKAYELLMESRVSDENLAYESRGALSTLWRATKMTGRAGWHWQSARCLKAMQKIQFSKLDNDIRKARVENIAAWHIGRRVTGKRRRFLQSLLEEAAAELRDLQHTYVREFREIALARRTVALLAAAIPNNKVLPWLVAQTHPERMEGLAFALHRDGPAAIDERVCAVGLAHLQDTPKAGVFIANWLVRQYFENRCFDQVLRETLTSIQQKQNRGRAYIEMRRYIAKAISGEIAARCAAVICRGARPQLSHYKATAFFENLMGDGLYNHIEPKGAGFYGAQPLEERALRSALWQEEKFEYRYPVDITVPENTVWIETKTKSRILSFLEDALLPFDRKSKVRSGKSTNISFVDVTAVLSSGDKAPWLTVSFYFGMVSNSQRDLLKVADTMENHLLPRLLELELDGFCTDWHISASPDKNGTRIDLEFGMALPRIPASDEASLLHAEIDRLFDAHVDRLTGREKAAVTPTLHEARRNVEELVSSEPGLQYRMRVATANAAALKLRQTIHWGDDARPVNLFEVLTAMMTSYGLHTDLPGSFDIDVAINEPHLRSTLATILDNARKVIRVKGNGIGIEIIERFEIARVTFRAPYVEPHLYPAGCGVGIASVTAQLELFGARLKARREGDSWRVDIFLRRKTKRSPVGADAG